MSDERLVEAVPAPQSWNKLVNKLQTVQLRLRESAEGRAGISQLLDDPDDLVRVWSATFALGWDTERATATLQEISAAGGLIGFEAETALREFDAGRLNTTWEPQP